MVTFVVAARGSVSAAPQALSATMPRTPIPARTVVRIRLFHVWVSFLTDRAIEDSVVKT